MKGSAQDQQLPNLKGPEQRVLLCISWTDTARLLKLLFNKAIIIGNKGKQACSCR